MKGIETVSSHRPDGELLNFLRKNYLTMSYTHSSFHVYYKEMSSNSQIDRH